MPDISTLVTQGMNKIGEHDMSTDCDSPAIAESLGYLIQAHNLLREQSETDVLVPQLRRLQYAANMLNYDEFCDATGWPRDDYSLAKFREFQALGRLHVFDNGTLWRAVHHYESLVTAHRQASGPSRPADAPMTDANIPMQTYATEQGRQRHTRGGPA
jgi:hypothetical protein